MAIRMRKSYPLGAKMYRIEDMSFCYSARAIVDINTHLHVPHEGNF